MCAWFSAFFEKALVRRVMRRLTILSTCPYRKSNPDVLMMQASEERLGDDAADGLDHRRSSLFDRHPRHHLFVQGGKDPYQRHGAGQCRCSVILESLGPEESGPRCRRLSKRNQL